jgi:copper chaperone CopZ
MNVPARLTAALLCASLLAVGLEACGNTVSTSGFKGEAHEVAQAIANLQTDATARDEKKVCENDLASAVVKRLSSATGGCKQAIKNQLAEVDGFEVSVQSVQLGASATPRTATAQVKSIYQGKTRSGTLSLVKEGGKWKVSSIG